MFNSNFLFEFSRHHCIAICAFLVPANLLLTLRTLLLVDPLHSQAQVRWVMVIASFFALLLLLHNFTWFIIGVVMAPTYILLVLACVCLSFNLWAIAHPTSMKQLLRQLPSASFQNFLYKDINTFHNKTRDTNCVKPYQRS
jgi:hypothetical protein